jgi:Protein of unknown function (DUF3108)
VHGKLKFSLKLAQFTALLVSLTCTVVAQQKSEAPQAPFNSRVYRIGERLTYDVSFSQFVSVAHVELLTAARGKFFGSDGVQLRAHVETNGVVNVALLSLNNDYTTYVYPETGLPYRAQQLVREAGRTSQASVDYNQPAGTSAIPPKLRTGEFPGVYDLLSALSRVRAMPLLAGSTYFISVRHENEEYHAEVRVAGKELIKTKVGSFDAIATRVVVKNDHNYDARVFFSDDEWHVPVLITARPKAGDIRAELVGSALIMPAGPGNQPTAVTPTTTPPTTNPLANPTPGQTDPPGSAATVEEPATRLDLPFKVGEQLNYQVYAGAGNQPVGSLTFSVQARGRYFNRDGLQFSVKAQTNGPGARILPVTDQITSYVDPTTLLPFRSELNLSEGRYRTTRIFNLDQNRGWATPENSRDRMDIPVGTHDLLSAIYAIRTFDLSPGRRNAISLMATKLPRTLTVKSDRREMIELNGQKVSAIVVSLQTDDPEDRFQLKIWFGDDSRHLPLRIVATTELGVLHADLSIVPTSHQ